MMRSARVAVLAGLWPALLLGSCGRSSPPPPADASARPKGASDSEDRDWPQWGRTPSKNMSSPERDLPFSFSPGKLRADGSVDLATTKNVLWAARMGSQTYGNPVVSRGRLFIGTNNEGRGDPRFKGDYSLLKCLEAATGRELWTLTVPKLGTGKVGDWEFLGICSSPTVVEDRVYVLSNRSEVVCLDVHGMADGNQGEQDEGEYMSYVGTTPRKPFEVRPTDADILWRYNMIQELGVFPHNITAGSPLVVGDLLYCNTSNGVTYDHTETPSPKAPALIALNRKLAEQPGATPAQILVGEEASGISRRIFHGSWIGPAWAEVGGKGVLLYGGPDGFLYAFDPTPVKDADGFGILKEKWRYDCVPADLRYRDGHKDQPIKYASLGDGPSEVMATPVVYKGRAYVAIGQDPEHRAGPGNLSCVDVETGKKVWDLRINRSMSTCGIADDRVYTADFSGWLYSIDALTGTVYWKYDTQSEIWCSPLVADHKVYMGTNDGTMTLFDTDRMKRLNEALGADLLVEAKQDRLLIKRDGKSLRELSGAERGLTFQEVKFPAALNCSPIVAQGILYVATMRHLYAIKEQRP